MIKIVWTREGSGYDIEYVGRIGDRIVARVYRGGDRYYPWSINMPGDRVGNSATLGSAKDNVRRIIEAKEPPATIHDPADCEFCANDPEQCHHDIDCEARAWANGFCGPHQPDPRSYH